MFRIVATLMALTAAMIMSCSDDNGTDPANDKYDDKNSLTVNGGGYSNATFHGFKDEASHGMVVSGGASAIGFGGETPVPEGFAISIVVNGTTTGSYPINASAGNSVNMAITKSAGSTTYLSIPGSGTITVTEYGSTGGRCKGTFNATLISLDGMTQLTVTNGKFDVPVK